MAFESERTVAATIGVPVAKRHIFLCCDQTKPKCCDKDRGLAAWDYLKARLKANVVAVKAARLRSVSEAETAISGDFLFVGNAASNTVSSFRLRDDGVPLHVGGSPAAAG